MFAERPGGEAPGHFGLAVKDYAHSGAESPLPDLITQRLLKAAVAGDRRHADFDEEDLLAKHCTEPRMPPTRSNARSASRRPRSA